MSSTITTTTNINHCLPCRWWRISMKPWVTTTNHSHWHDQKFAVNFIFFIGIRSLLINQHNGGNHTYKPTWFNHHGRLCLGPRRPLLLPTGAPHRHGQGHRGELGQVAERHVTRRRCARCWLRSGCALVAPWLMFHRDSEPIVRL